MVEIFRELEQGTPEWHACRLGLPTASRFKDILAKGEGKTRKRYLLDLAGERLTGECAETYSNSHMERGKAMEDEARDMYVFQTDTEIERVGFVKNGIAGCSPDSLIGEAGGVEIKTKLPALLLECLMADKVPSEHVAQLQGFLWVTGREWVDLVCYWPRLPLFVKRVHRDEPYIATLKIAVQEFNDELLELVRKFQ